MRNNILVTGVIVVLVGIIGFFGGMKYQESRRGSFARQLNGQGIRPGQNGNRQGFRPVSGEIISSDATSVTVKLTDGSTKIVILTDKMTVNKAEAGTKDDLKTGQSVAVFGSENADGTVTAESVQLNPLLRIGGLRGASPSAAPTP